MVKSPFKFLDSYTKDDRDVFFGRDREIEEIYQKVYESKTLVLYGISGTGKTSLINCGLANKFEKTDWLPVTVRRGRNIMESLKSELEKVGKMLGSPFSDGSEKITGKNSGTGKDKSGGKKNQESLIIENLQLVIVKSGKSLLQLSERLSI